MVIIDEIIDYLLWKHKRSLEQGTCLISGFLLGASASEFTDGSPGRAAICAILAVLVLWLTTKNDKPRTYDFPDDDSPWQWRCDDNHRKEP